MIAQVQNFGVADIEQVKAQLEFEQYLAQQANTIAPIETYCMSQSFIFGVQNPNPTPINTSQTSPNREFIKHLLIGSPKAVKSTIHYLQVLGYADVGAWSPLLATANPGEFMSILSRSILVQ
jgi:hypothetical protein